MKNGGDAKKQKQRGNLGLIFVLAGLGVLIVGLVVGIVLLKIIQDNQQVLSSEEQFGAIDSVQLNNVVSGYMFGRYDKNEVGSVSEYLEKIMLTSDNKEDRLNSRYYLSIVLYYTGRQEEAVALLNDGLENELDISDQDRFFLLTNLLGFYADMDDIDAQRVVLQNIIDLPDDMVLSDQSWLNAKEMYINLLQEIDDDENA